MFLLGDAFLRYSRELSRNVNSDTTLVLVRGVLGPLVATKRMMFLSRRKSTRTNHPEKLSIFNDHCTNPVPRQRIRHRSEYPRYRSLLRIEDTMFRIPESVTLERWCIRSFDIFDNCPFSLPSRTSKMRKRLTRTAHGGPAGISSVYKLQRISSSFCSV